ncbi:MAG: acyltransferase, partial [Burkholderiales bacterium]|nr:acyltransferase [Opitutaceae bacterium]
MISPTVSLVLDFLRVGSALLVVVYHLPNYGFAADFRGGNSFGHLMVVVFFVLSGYVVAAAEERERTRGAWAYAVARVSRIFSVLWPVLLVVGGIEWVLAHTAGSLRPEDFSRDGAGARYALTAVMANEVWWWSSAPLLMGPAWSLAYEVYYYALYGIACAPWRWRTKGALLGLGLLVIGPKACLLAPAWFLGVALYRWGDAVRPSVAGGWAGIGAGVGLGAWALASGWYFPGYPAEAPLYFSNSWVSDLVFAISPGLVIWGASGLVRTPGWLARIEGPIRGLAAVSFTLYLMHRPLLALVAHFSGHDR